MIADNNNNKKLDWTEFSKVFHDYRLQVSEQELKILFETFDVDHDGHTSFDEFIRNVVGEMNDFRRNIVWQAFRKLDKDGSGEIEKNDITGVYDASHHPEVREGKKTEEDVLTDFLDTFEIHSSLLHPGDYNHKVTFDEFCEYYNNISANIDNDQYFELMITNAWKLNEA